MYHYAIYLIIIELLYINMTIAGELTIDTQQ